MPRGIPNTPRTPKPIPPRPTANMKERALELSVQSMPVGIEDDVVIARARRFHLFITGADQ